MYKTSVDPEKVFLPSLYIKLGLMNQFVKALHKDGECFNIFLKYNWKNSTPNYNNVYKIHVTMVYTEIHGIKKINQLWVFCWKFFHVFLMKWIFWIYNILNHNIIFTLFCKKFQHQFGREIYNYKFLGLPERAEIELKKTRSRVHL